MISSIASPVSTIKADVLRVGVSAHDIANINTPNFAQTVVSQTEKYPDGTEISAMNKIQPPAKDLSATDFAEEAAELLKAKADLSFNARVIKTQDKMLGELLDIKA